MPPVANFNFDIWSQEDQTSTIYTDFLLPNGIFIQMWCKKDDTLENIKKKLWQEAQLYPLFNLLEDMRFYTFDCINQTAEKEELVDERRRLCEVKPFIPVLRVVRKEEESSNRNEQLLNAKISILIGKGLHDFDEMKNNEVDDFRKKMKVLCDRHSEEMMSKSWEEKAKYLYPPELIDDSILNHDDLNSQFLITIWYNMVAASPNSAKKKLQVKKSAHPSEIVKLALRKIDQNSQLNEDSRDYILKLCGRDEYIIGDYPILQYKYIKRTDERNEGPQLSLVKKSDVLVDGLLSPQAILPPRILNGDLPPYIPPKNTKYTWDLNPELRVVVDVKSASNLNEDWERLQVRSRIYHGSEGVTSIASTGYGHSESASETSWDQRLEFDIDVRDLPRNAKLCFVLCEVFVDKKVLPKNTQTINKREDGKKTKKADKKNETKIIPLAWVNIPLFDYRDYLHSGPITLYLWPLTDQMMMEGFNYMGTTLQNLEKDTAIALRIDFNKYSEFPLMYPNYKRIADKAAELADYQDLGYIREEEGDKMDNLKQILEGDPLQIMEFQESEFVWKYRVNLLHTMPEKLPRLLKAVKWNCADDVAQIQNMLLAWPPLEVDQAIELLDFSQADKTVRSFAVNKCLSKISDEEVSLYLLQLIQALKYEMYLDCDLATFLLTRAIRNLSLGHFFFWHLRSEMHNSSIAVRFGLLLESYCRGAKGHIALLQKQIDCLEKLKAVNGQVKQQTQQKEKSRALQEMKESLVSHGNYTDALSDLKCPLSPAHWLRKLKISECKFMKSKMKPLWLVFENKDHQMGGKDFQLIYKNGDDLRQDMLTLQMIQLMDDLWLGENLDLKMSPYRALATGSQAGMIEVVTNSDTIANIQKKKGKITMLAAYNKDALLCWLKENNPEPAALNRAVELFTRSCAGYCVATYVLGIGDRHNDNIMLKKSGQLFHIDFGHILGNFKSKFGIQRERVPFILTDDFVYVMTEGRKGESKSDEFKQFKQYCEEAYLILRRKGGLFISLFTMMLYAGMPELTRIEDINYLRDTLRLSMPEEEALRHFQKKFQEALKNSWKTKLNWTAHHMQHADN